MRRRYEPGKQFVGVTFTLDFDPAHPRGRFHDIDDEFEVDGKDIVLSPRRESLIEGLIKFFLVEKVGQAVAQFLAAAFVNNGCLIVPPRGIPRVWACEHAIYLLLHGPTKRHGTNIPKYLVCSGTAVRGSRPLVDQDS